MEKKIIKISEYIISVINTINDFQEFQYNKPEIIKSIKDIVLCCNNILNQNQNQNTKSSYSSNNTKSKNNDQDKTKSTVSNILGLQFNYDAYLTKSDANFLIGYEEKKNNIFKNLSKTTKSSLRSTESNNIVVDKKNKNSKNIYKNNIISNILFKINNDENIKPILFKLYGNNIKEKLLSNNLNDDFLIQIKNVIDEIEKIKFQSIKNEIYDKNENTTDLLKNDFNKNFNTIQYSDPKIESYYKRSLRYNSPKSLKISLSSNNINQNNNNYSRKKNTHFNNTGKRNKDKKPFINATCIYGRYFDEPLQKGGASKLTPTYHIYRSFSENKN